MVGGGSRCSIEVATEIAAIMECKTAATKRRIRGLHRPPGHKYTVIAHQISAECCLEFTAKIVIECFMGCLVSSFPSLGTS